MRRRLRLPLAYQLVAVQLVLIMAVLLAVSAVSVENTRASFARDEGRRVLALAENLASNPGRTLPRRRAGRRRAARGGGHPAGDLPGSIW